VRTQNIDFVRLVLEPQYGCVTFGGRFLHAVYRAVETNQPDAARLLLQHTRDATHKRKSAFLGLTLGVAC
jgi:hypothetical protein